MAARARPCKMGTKIYKKKKKELSEIKLKNLETQGVSNEVLNLNVQAFPPLPQGEAVLYINKSRILPGSVALSFETRLLTK